MISIWERNNFVHYDHLIIGSGIVGLTAAYFLQKKYPQQKILVLERGLIPSGASTKNAGFACMGSATELLDDLQSMSEEQVVALFLLRKKGLETLTSLLGKEAMDYSADGSYELIHKHDIEAIAQIDKLNKLLRKELGGDAFSMANEKIDSFAFNSTEVEALIENKFEGQIDTGKMMSALIHLVQSVGVEIKTGCEVNSFHETSTHVEVLCNQGADLPISFFGKTLSICTNAFTKNLLPELDVKPGRGQVLITKPIRGLKFKGIFHMDKGYFYFREYHNRVLFGGGRNLDFNTETTTEFALNKQIQDELIHRLQHTILPNNSFEIDMQWAGIMAFGSDKQPILKPYSSRIFIGVRMGGMGVAIGSEIGFALSEKIVQH